MLSGKLLTNVVFRIMLVLFLPAIMLLTMVKGLELTNHINLPVVDLATQVVQQDGKFSYREVTLPHKYTLGGGFSYGRYNVVLPKAGGETTAILLPPFRDTLGMRAGGELIWQTAPVAYSRERMMPRFRYQPVYHELPNRLFDGESLSVSV